MDAYFWIQSGTNPRASETNGIIHFYTKFCHFGMSQTRMFLETVSLEAFSSGQIIMEHRATPVLHLIPHHPFSVGGDSP